MRKGKFLTAIILATALISAGNLQAQQLVSSQAQQFVSSTDDALRLCELDWNGDGVIDQEDLYKEHADGKTRSGFYWDVIRYVSFDSGLSLTRDDPSRLDWNGDGVVDYNDVYSFYYQLQAWEAGPQVYAEKYPKSDCSDLAEVVLSPLTAALQMFEDPEVMAQFSNLPPEAAADEAIRILLGEERPVSLETEVIEEFRVAFIASFERGQSYPTAGGCWSDCMEGAGCGGLTSKIGFSAGGVGGAAVAGAMSFGAAASAGVGALFGFLAVGVSCYGADALGCRIGCGGSRDGDIGAPGCQALSPGDIVSDSECLECGGSLSCQTFPCTCTM